MQSQVYLRDHDVYTNETLSWNTSRGKLRPGYTMPPSQHYILWCFEFDCLVVATEGAYGKLGTVRCKQTSDPRDRLYGVIKIPCLS